MSMRTKTTRLLGTAAVVIGLAACDGPGTPTPPPPPPPPVLSVTSVSPNTAPGGTDVAIIGTGFRAGATVTFGGVAGEVRAGSNTVITVRTPEREPGRVDVMVTNPGGESATLAGGFTLLASLRVDNVDPDTGYHGFLFTVFGSGFMPGVTVTFNGVRAPSTRDLFGGTIIYGALPLHDPGPADITITNPDGRSVTISKALTFVPAPVLTASPPTVAVGASITVSWVANPRSSIDYISLFHESASSDIFNELATQHVPAGSGTMTFTAPDLPGRYDFRYLPFENQFAIASARSNVVTVTPASLVDPSNITAISGEPGRQAR